MRNYEKRLQAIKRIADSKTAKVVFLDFRNGQYFLNGQAVNIEHIRADVLIIDDIPDEPEKEGEENCPEHEFQTNS